MTLICTQGSYQVKKILRESVTSSIAHLIVVISRTLTVVMCLGPRSVISAIRLS